MSGYNTISTHANLYFSIGSSCYSTSLSSLAFLNELLLSVVCYLQISSDFFKAILMQCYNSFSVLKELLVAVILYSLLTIRVNPD